HGDSGRALARPRAGRLAALITPGSESRAGSFPAVATSVTRMIEGTVVGGPAAPHRPSGRSDGSPPNRRMRRTGDPSSRGEAAVPLRPGALPARTRQLTRSAARRKKG